jgi:RNA polymerase sigma-70 factor (ECF subfamily)
MGPDSISRGLSDQARFEALYASCQKARTFLVAWRRLDEVPDGEEARLWLYGVARRALANQRRGDQRRTALAERLRTELATAPAAYESESRLGEIVDARASLTEGERELLRLEGWEALDVGQIATVLGISHNAVRIRLHRSTRWGTGYVLTNPSETTICFVAPGLNSQDWGASCASRSQATASGTIGHAWAYDSATHSARFIQLFPRGAVVTTRAGDGGRRSASLDNGVLAIDVSQPEQIAITVAHHTPTEQVAPDDASPAYGTGSGSPGATSTTVTGMSTATNP